MRLTLPAHIWAAIDHDRTDQGAHARDRDERVIQGLRPPGQGIYLGSWIDRFLATHVDLPITYPSPAWLYANGEGIPTRGLLPPPGWTMTSRQVNLARRVPGLPDSAVSLRLRARARADGRPMAEVVRRLVRQHFEGYPDGTCCHCDNDPQRNHATGRHVP